MSGVKKPAPAPCWQRELSHPHIDNNMIPPVYVVHAQYYFDSIAHVHRESLWTHLYLKRQCEHDTM